MQSNNHPIVPGKKLQDQCKALRNEVLESKHEPFILKYFIDATSYDPNEQDIKILVSTFNLLENLKHSCMAQTDATYKLGWQRLFYHPCQHEQ